MTNKQNLINHVQLVLDASLSMRRHTPNLIKVADGQIKYLADLSQTLNQETRVSVYVFNEIVTNLIYDMDVLRLPSIASLYFANGNTALVDATIKTLDDLSQTATLYGDHAFLTFVLTDGEDNRSRNDGRTLLRKLDSLPDNWTTAALVPDQRSVFSTKNFGFPKNNIAVWDANSAAGFEEAGETIRNATSTFMQSRATGVRGTRNLFSTGAEAVNATTVHQSLAPLSPREYAVYPVHSNPNKVDGRWGIQDFILSRGVVFDPSKNFYQFTKREKIQPQKKIMIREKDTGKVYGGDHARDLLGLGRDHVSVKPDLNRKYDVFVQSTSNNRKLIPATDLLVLR